MGFAVEARWPQVRAGCALGPPKMYANPGVTGHELIATIGRVVERLGHRYTGQLLWNKQGATEGDPEAFAKLHRRPENSVPKPSAAVTLLAMEDVDRSGVAERKIDTYPS